MGREIRMVPPNWQHPKYTEDNARVSTWVGQYHPMYDRPYREAMDEWIENDRLWKLGEHPSQEKGYGDECEHYAEYDGGPPDVSYYRPYWEAGEATWYQVYETVSEGTPVTPAFATKEELVEYLVEHGDLWDQKRGDKPWSRKAAERFVMGSGWAPSMIGIVGHGLMTGVEGMALMQKEESAK